MHPLQKAALAVVALSTLIMGAGVLMAFIITFFPDAIRYKQDSRLIRWPRAIKAFWIEFSDFIDTVSNGHRARKMMREIWQSET